MNSVKCSVSSVLKIYFYFVHILLHYHNDPSAGRSRSFRGRLLRSLRRLSLPWRAPLYQTTSPQDPRTPSRDSAVDSKLSKLTTTSNDTYTPLFFRIFERIPMLWQSGSSKFWVLFRCHEVPTLLAVLIVFLSLVLRSTYSSCCNFLLSESVRTELVHNVRVLWCI